MYMNKKSEEFFIKYLKSIPDKHIKQFYNDVEWTPYPVLVIKEFQRRFKPNDEEFLEKLLESVDDAKEKGQKIGRLAKIRGLQLSKRVKARAKKTVSKKITKAKRMIRSSDYNVEVKNINKNDKELVSNLEKIMEQAKINQKKQTKKLLDFCGLDWNDKCMDFYKNERSVSTASVMQVRKPIYKNSINSWKKYQRHLSILIDELN